MGYVLFFLFIFLGTNDTEAKLQQKWIVVVKNKHDDRIIRPKKGSLNNCDIINLQLREIKMT